LPIPRIVLTSGEPAGIGPDCCVSIAQRDWACELIVAGDAKLLQATAQALKLPLGIEAYAPAATPIRHQPGRLRVIDIPLHAPVRAGEIDPANAHYVLGTLNRACDGCVQGEFAAMVTAPLQKSALLDAGIAFTGHTEYLAERTHAAMPVMLLVADSLRVALVTTHLPLASVPAAITLERLRATLRVVHDDLGRKFSIKNPRLMVLGLNPHAGESGHLGREEIEVIAPVIAELQDQGLSVTGPVPADSAFTPRLLQSCDAVIAMYHDQGLPVIKHVGFGRAVNVTLGLPIVRTSVDHGTALALARSGRADSSSLAAALELALRLVG
jgi:4-hydroxythreonine-4-phosphate dehydrogenase